MKILFHSIFFLILLNSIMYISCKVKRRIIYYQTERFFLGVLFFLVMFYFLIKAGIFDIIFENYKIAEDSEKLYLEIWSYFIIGIFGLIAIGMLIFAYYFGRILFDEKYEN